MSTLEKILLFTSFGLSVIVAIAMIVVWLHLAKLDDWTQAMGSEWRPWVNQTFVRFHGPVDPPEVPDPPPNFPG